MTNVTLTRIVKPTIVHRHGRASIEDSVETLYVNFEDYNGQSVSLAFDGRYDTEYESGRMIRETYSIYSDSPVMANGMTGSAEDVVRVLRDALSALLGD